MKTFCIALLLAASFGLVEAQSAAAASEVRHPIMRGRVIHHPVHGRIVHRGPRGRIVRHHPHHPIHGRIIHHRHP